jgi:hypothetical protein
MQRMKRPLIMSVLGFLIVTSLAACSTTPQRIEVTSRPINKPELILPKVDQVSMRKIEWIIITEANMEEEVAKWTAGGKPLAVFAITAEGYENLGQNFSDIRALVQQQQSIILAYDNYYKASEEALDNAESDRALNAAVRASEESKGLDLNPFD